MKTGIQTNRKYKIISSVLAIIIVGAAYGYYIYLSHYQEGVIPPLAKSTDFISKTFDAQDGIVFHQPTGTHIEISGAAPITSSQQLNILSPWVFVEQNI